MANSLRKCKRCAEYKPASDGVKTPAGWFCCHAHAVEFAIAKSQAAARRKAVAARKAQEAERKRERAEHRQRKMDVKPISYWIKRAQAAVNVYVRARDDGMPCPCCGTTVSAQWDASHYRPAGINSAIRFNPDNIHRCCVVCNRHKSGNLTAFRVWMVEKYGDDFVTDLDNNHETKRYTREELESIESEYKAKLAEIKSCR